MLPRGKKYFRKNTGDDNNNNRKVEIKNKNVDEIE